MFDSAVVSVISVKLPWAGESSVLMRVWRIGFVPKRQASRLMLSMGTVEPTVR